MNLEVTGNPNYAATVIKVPPLVPIAKADFLVGLPMFGLNALVSKDTQEGILGVFFPPECQLSFDYAFHNSLHSHATKTTAGGELLALNADPNAKGYLGDNRRVRAITLRGARSDALFMPLESLSWAFETDKGIVELKEGDVFDTINGHQICCKYVIPGSGGGASMGGSKKMPSRVDGKMFPEHFETPQFFRVDRNLDDYLDHEVIITQKLHGTSIRIGNTVVSRKLSLRDRIAARFGVRVADTEFDYIFGSHHVIKDVNNPNHKHFYGSDLWTQYGEKLRGLIPENYILYGELIGWVPSAEPAQGIVEPGNDGGFAAIQKNYTYDLSPGECRLHVYRVSVVNAQGTVLDMSWDALQAFCASIGVETVRELWRGKLREFRDIADQFMDENYAKYAAYIAGNTTLVSFPRWLIDRPKSFNPVPLSPMSPCDEGVVLRLENDVLPFFAKLKSPKFLGHETEQLDTGVADIESTEGMDNAEPVLV